MVPDIAEVLMERLEASVKLNKELSEKFLEAVFMMDACAAEADRLREENQILRDRLEALGASAVTH